MHEIFQHKALQRTLLAVIFSPEPKGEVGGCWRKRGEIFCRTQGTTDNAEPASEHFFFPPPQQDLPDTGLKVFFYKDI